jgi:SAM-dependent methyltransferase
MFRSTADDPTDTPSMRAAQELLGDGGSVLDVGCGGGRSSLPLGSDLVQLVIGVDEQQSMLDQFSAAAAVRQIAASTVRGRWPDVAAETETADVVVCHHVAYNVGPIGPFVQALADHARSGVVVELPDRHPTSPLNPLWKHFWGIDRPQEPTAELFVAVVEELGWSPSVTYWTRPPRPGPLDRDELVAFVRQRLCLGPERDPEVHEVLGPDPVLSADRIATVSWRS